MDRAPQIQTLRRASRVRLSRRVRAARQALAKFNQFAVLHYPYKTVALDKLKRSCEKGTLPEETSLQRRSCFALNQRASFGAPC